LSEASLPDIPLPSGWTKSVKSDVYRAKAPDEEADASEAAGDQGCPAATPASAGGQGWAMVADGAERVV
jgi:hypothetical protein